MKCKTDFLIFLISVVLLVGCSAEASVNQLPPQINISQQQTNSNSSQGGNSDTHAETQQGLAPIKIGQGAR
jgi:uncharacterized lipoprotein YajG